jgi:hypothetical protein
VRCLLSASEARCYAAALEQKRQIKNRSVHWLQEMVRDRSGARPTQQRQARPNVMTSPLPTLSKVKTTAQVMAEVCQRIAADVDAAKLSLFLRVLSQTLALPAWDYGLWAQRNGLGDLDSEARISLIRARLNSTSPLLAVNQTRVGRYAHMGALIREGRDKRRTRNIAERFSFKQAAAAE